MMFYYIEFLFAIMIFKEQKKTWYVRIPGFLGAKNTRV